MNILGLEQIRAAAGLSFEDFAKALTVAAHHMVNKPLSEIGTADVAYTYAACAQIDPSKLDEI